LCRGCTLWLHCKVSEYPSDLAPTGNSGDKQQPVEAFSRRTPVYLYEIAPERTGHGLPLSKCEAYNRVYDQPYESR